VLFIVHRKEIVDQVIKTFTDHGVDMNLAQVGMVQTFSRNLNQLYPPSVIFVDEAHHALANSYKKLLNAYPNAVKLLFTATPWRMSGKGFDEVATDLIQGKSVKWLTEHGNLAPFDYYAPQNIDSSQLKVNSVGEFDSDSVEQALKPKIYGSAVETYLELANGTQAIAYTYNVESAHKLADEFNAKGIRTEAVDGKTPPDKRKQIIDDYRKGIIRIVTNAELFTEGLDLPNVDTVIMMRPTQSLSLYLQFAMRALNPREGKVAKLIDHVGNVSRFGLPNEDRTWSLHGSNKKTRSQERAQSIIDNPIITCDRCFGTWYKKESPLACPYCGATVTSKTVTYETVESAKLEKIAQTAKDKRIAMVRKMHEDSLVDAVANMSVSDLKSMQQLQAYAKLHNYKPGWAYNMAKRKGLIY
jgi:superfamily II DNA or RNA helicase